MPLIIIIISFAFALVTDAFSNSAHQDKSDRSTIVKSSLCLTAEPKLEDNSEVNILDDVACLKSSNTNQTATIIYH